MRASVFNYREMHGKAIEIHVVGRNVNAVRNTNLGCSDAVGVQGGSVGELHHIDIEVGVLFID